MANHIRLDRVKIKSNINHLLSTQAHFTVCTDPRTGDVKGEIYNSKNDTFIPYNLYIATSKPKQTLTIEFSSKILRDDYPNLISIENLEDCLKKINTLGICNIDTNAIMQSGCITSMDITTDVRMTLNDDLLNALNILVGNYRRYKWKHYDGKGITFTRDVESSDCKEEIKIYDKAKEIMKADNAPFLRSLDNPNTVIDYFSDKTRFEITLPTSKKIRDFLGISDNYIADVLNTTCNPILKMFDRVFGSSPSSTNVRNKGFTGFLMGCALNSYDLKEIEMIARSLIPNPKTRKKTMNMLESINTEMKCKCPNNPIAEVRKLLE